MGVRSELTMSPVLAFLRSKFRAGSLSHDENGVLSGRRCRVFRTFLPINEDELMEVALTEMVALGEYAGSSCDRSVSNKLKNLGIG